ADQLFKEEAKVLRVAMDHEDEDIYEFVEAHKTCLNDIMYLPTREAYGLSSVAGNAEKLAAFQNEFDTMRAAKIWSQVEATFKQMDTAGTEYECLQALKRQEQLAASNRINSIWEDVQKQKELENTLQNRYGDLLIEQERIHNLMEKYRQEAIAQEAAQKRLLQACSQ
nr:cell division cycle 5-like protein [Tanacetum cinerariifolium]